MNVSQHGRIKSELIVAAAAVLTVVWLSAVTGVFGADFPRDKPADKHAVPPTRFMIEGISTDASIVKECKFCAL